MKSEKRPSKKALLSALVVGIILIIFLAVSYFLISKFAKDAIKDGSFKMQLTVTYLVEGVLVLATVIGYVVWADADANRCYRYKIVTDADGVIVFSDEKFRVQFPRVMELSENIAHFKEHCLNTLRLKTDDGEFLLVCRSRKNRKGGYEITAGDLNAFYSTDSTGQRGSMRNTFELFLARGQRVFVGSLQLGNLFNIKSMFGAEFSRTVRSVVIHKITEKFVFVYDIDDTHIGVLYPDGKKLDDILHEIDEIINYFNQPVRVDNNLVNIGLKAGFAMCDKTMQDKSFNYSMSAADAALTRAEQEHDISHYIYYESQKELYSKFFMEFDILQLIQDGAFELQYQPQYSFKEKRITGFEAFFRIKSSFNISVNTADFIAYTEKSGYMVYLGDFILETGMRFAKQLEGRNVTVSLNISPVQFMQAGFVDNFLNIYRKHGLKPGSVNIEITESFLMSTYDETLKKLQTIVENGVAVHLDDFGTRYSSLLYLKKLPISVIKIDKGFISDIQTSDYTRAVMDMILGMAKELHLPCISEGVETKEQALMLQSMGCEKIQGYLISRPVADEDAMELLDSFHCDIDDIEN